jgi:hypothetical protein
MASKLQNAIGILFGLAVIAAGGYLYYSEMQATTDVTDVEATVISSSVGEVGSATGSDSYTINVRYRYTYDGETYRSWSLCPGAGSGCAPTSTSQADMEEFLEEYPEGATVTVYVSRSDPSEAYLLQEEAPLVYLGVSVFGLLFVLVAVNDLRTGQ